MSERDDGGPVFPFASEFDPVSRVGRDGYGLRPRDGCSSLGMSLRDYFAASALGALIDAGLWAARVNTANAQKLVAESAYEIADEMLKARKV